MTIITICVIALIGMVIQAAVLNYWVLMAGRLINALSMGMSTEVEDSELADANVRLIGIEANCLCAHVHGRTCSCINPRWSGQFLPIVVVHWCRSRSYHCLRFFHYSDWNMVI